MAAISALSPGILDRIGAGRAAVSGRSNDPVKAAPAGSAGGTRVTLAYAAEAGVVYGDPRNRAGFNRLWSFPVSGDDGVSALMARNLASHSSMLDQWRGLGGALLKRFGETGESYSQALVDEPTNSADDGVPGMTPQDQEQLTAAILTRQASKLESVGTNAPTAGLTVRTRSGQSVELKIAVDGGVNGIPGIKVEIESSGALSDEERAAVAHLADGLDRALEGLARNDAVALDFSGLTDYDRDVLSSVDLSVKNPMTHQLLGDFSLHLGDDNKSVHLKGSDGELNLKVDGSKPLEKALGNEGAGLQSALDRIGAAGERGRANAALVQQMKAVFKQLHEATGTDKKDAESESAEALAGAAAGVSGLADFEASFGGDTWRQNRAGTVNEAGQVQYQLSQKTAAKPLADGRPSGAQTVEEQLAADFKRAPGGAMLFVSNGNFLATKIRDASTVTTLFDVAADGRMRVLRKTDAQQLRQAIDFENHRVVHRQSWPSHQRQVERLA